MGTTYIATPLSTLVVYSNTTVHLKPGTTTHLHPFLGLPHTPYPFLGSTLNSSIIMNLLNSEVGFLCSPRFGGWISAEQVIKQQVDDAASMDDTTLTSVSWAMSVGDLTIVDAA